VLRKELRDTLKTFAQSLMILLVIPIALLLDWHVLHSQWEISGIYQPVFLAVIIIYAVYSGVSIFQAEKRDRALEYLLSLPVSRWKIVTVKVLPRFVLLLLLLAAAGVLSMFGSFLADAVSMIIIFLLAITLSLAVESMINAMVGVLLLNAILYYASLVLSYLTMEHHWFGSDVPIVAISQVLPALLLLLPLGAAFTLAVKHFDLKPLKWQAGPYLLIALPGMMIMITFVLLFIKKYLAWIKTIG
jgi:ABC-type Na+ efflux pump permease subunit